MAIQSLTIPNPTPSGTVNIDESIVELEIIFELDEDISVKQQPPIASIPQIR